MALAADVIDWNLRSSHAERHQGYSCWPMLTNVTAKCRALSAFVRVIVTSASRSSVSSLFPGSRHSRTSMKNSPATRPDPATWLEYGIRWPFACLESFPPRCLLPLYVIREDNNPLRTFLLLNRLCGNASHNGVVRIYVRSEIYIERRASV